MFVGLNNSSAVYAVHKQTMYRLHWRKTRLDATFIDGLLRWLPMLHGRRVVAFRKNERKWREIETQKGEGDDLNKMEKDSLQ